MIKSLEEGITRAYGGSTEFEMEDAHAWYFQNKDGDVETEVKVVKEDGVLWQRDLGTEDWYLAFMTKEELLLPEAESMQRSISIQAKGYAFNFTTNASESELGLVMKKLTKDFNAGTRSILSDDDIIPALKEAGFEADRIPGVLPDPDQIINADW
ncbi:hypothetical protein [Paenibacillus taichungensis]